MCFLTCLQFSHVVSENIGSGKLLEDSTGDKVRLNKQGSNSVLLMYWVMCSFPEHSRSKQFLWALNLSQAHNTAQNSI